MGSPRELKLITGFVVFVAAIGVYCAASPWKAPEVWLGRYVVIVDGYPKLTPGER
jgi:hypothetical protein